MNKKNKMSKKNKNIKIKTLLSKLVDQNKHGIVLPIRESNGSTDKYIKCLDELVEKGMLSKEFRDKASAERIALTLDDETYDLFYECLSL